jgi:hypothetical protein
LRIDIVEEEKEKRETHGAKPAGPAVQRSGFFFSFLFVSASSRKGRRRRHSKTIEEGTSL